MTNVLLVGNPGSGKTTLAAAAAIISLDEGRTVLHSGSVSYESPMLNNLTGKTPNKCHHIDMTELAMRAIRDHIKFPPNSVDCFIDEAYLLFESRKSGDPIQVIMTQFPLQARKMGMNLCIIGQLSSSVDKRLRSICDRSILCEKHYDDNGRPFFHYELFSQMQYEGSFEINSENAQTVFKYFDSEELTDIPFYEEWRRRKTVDEMLDDYYNELDHKEA